uniref:RNA helicase n=1 Tax=Lactuca sativa TaxID=4236 RepID=A0A9R1XL50_LACSA|nr:hypothetical protein LSAT_V11C400213520 [Lactuca sativa]
MEFAAWDANLVTPHKRMGNSIVRLESICDGDRWPLFYNVYSEVLSLIELCRVQLKVVQLTGEPSFSEMATALSGPPYIFVSTPACVQRCLSSGVLQAKSVHDYLSIIILDKADLLFTYGYEKNLKDLKTHITKRCQCLLMAATSSDDVESLKKLYLHNPYILTLAEVGDGKDEIVPKNVHVSP